MRAWLARSQLVAGSWRGGAEPIRPPWSLPERQFVELCTACGDCIGDCPRSILVRGRAGYPVVDFARGGCDFCGACAAACTASAFRPRDSAPWALAARFDDSCLAARRVTCRICAEWCDAHAIRFRFEVGGRAQPRVDATACSGCGACVSVCPTQAISLETTT